MKKNLFQLLMFSALFTVLYSCQAPMGGGSPGTSECDKLHAESFEGREQKDMITVQMAKELTQNYYNQREKSNIWIDGKLTNEQDARSIWYSLKALKQYIWAIEDTLCKQGCNIDSLNLGLHFYIAQYPGKEEIVKYGVDPSYAHHTTMLITATYRDGRTDVDFDPYHVGTTKCKPTPLKSYLMQGKTAGDQKLSGAEGEDPGVMNHGSLIPPPFGEGSFPSGN